MLFRNSICLILIFWFCISQNNAQIINIYHPDSIRPLNLLEKNDLEFDSKTLKDFYLNNLMIQKSESNYNTNLNFDYLKDFKFKSYNMREYYIFHRLNSTPAILRDNYPLPPYVDYQKIEVIKRKE